MGLRFRTIGVLAIATSLVICLKANIQAQPLGIMSQQPKQKPEHAVLSSPKGRFVFGQISDSSDDQFMLDTSTGRLWRMTKRADVGKCLTRVPYRTPEGQCSNIPEKISGSVPEAVKKQ